MWFPSVLVVEVIHDEILERGGGSEGVLNRGAIESAIQRARFGPFVEGGLAERAALILRGIAQDHPFVDGNKRTAYEITDIFLRANGYELDLEHDDVVRTMVRVARAELSLVEIRGWLQRNMTKS